jgi:hypothetical protein
MLSAACRPLHAVRCMSSAAVCSRNTHNRERANARVHEHTHARARVCACTRPHTDTHTPHAVNDHLDPHYTHRRACTRACVRTHRPTYHCSKVNRALRTQRCSAQGDATHAVRISCPSRFAGATSMRHALMYKLLRQRDVLQDLTVRPEAFDVYQPNPDEKGVSNVRLHNGGACSRQPQRALRAGDSMHSRSWRFSATSAGVPLWRLLGRVPRAVSPSPSPSAWIQTEIQTNAGFRYPDRIGRRAGRHGGNQSR